MFPCEEHGLPLGCSHLVKRAAEWERRAKCMSAAQKERPQSRREQPQYPAHAITSSLPEMENVEGKTAAADDPSFVDLLKAFLMVVHRDSQGDSFPFLGRKMAL